MPQRDARLRNPRDFRGLYARARSFRANNLVLYARPSRAQQPGSQKPLLRLGFSISKKVAKKAHERNLLKRRLREIARLDILPSFAAGRAFDAVVVARSGAPGADYLALRDEMLRLFAQAGLTGP